MNNIKKNKWIILNKILWKKTTTNNQSKQQWRSTNNNRKTNYKTTRMQQSIKTIELGNKKMQNGIKIKVQQQSA